MRSPGGSSNGTRWIPLAKWIHWPAYALSNLAALMMNESSGRPRAVSPTDDHGLVQFNRPSWQAEFKRVMKVAFFPGGQAAAREHKHGVYDPELNLRFALYVFHTVQHSSFLPAWRGDPAATF